MPCNRNGCLLYCVGKPAWNFNAQSEHLLNESTSVITHWAAEKMLSCRPGLELKTKKERVTRRKERRGRKRERDTERQTKRGRGRE